MEASKEVLLVIGILLISIIILLFTKEYLPFVDRDFEYIAKNVALTLDSVSAAPESIAVNYTLPRDEWKENKLLSNPRRVFLIAFDSDEVLISEDDFCTFALVVVSGALEKLEKSIFEQFLDYGEYIVESVTGKKVPSLPHEYFAAKMLSEAYNSKTTKAPEYSSLIFLAELSTAGAARYHYTHSDYMFSEPCYAINVCDMVAGVYSFAVQYAVEIISYNLGEPVYIYEKPNKIIFTKSANPSRIKINVKCNSII